ncbi:zinc finger, C2H2 type [Ancylostoma ceylanicum]|uniref:Zinc finger, C2H2 type n=1 Tax=Ancylostoma ceylanicum TaxID=53326 RepID=A0A0D6LCW1_9BILA|nr:zinc finger, C2H2 type [Ancylostoma ceylanicum]
MYSSDLYSQDDIVSTVPPYEIEPHGIIVASEEVVYSSPDKRTIENDTVTRNYSIVGGGGHISIEPDIETDPFSRRCQPFNCSDVDDSHKDCGSILRTPAALRKHALVHAERKFVCNQCGKGFAERTKLNRHMLTHTGEKAFKRRTAAVHCRSTQASEVSPLPGRDQPIKISAISWKN